MSYLFNFTKQAKMSRAAKGALIAPAALLAAGPLMGKAGLEDDIVELAKKFKYDITGTPFKYGPLKLMDSMGAVPSLMNAPGAFMPGVLTAAGAGAGGGKLVDLLQSASKKNAVNKSILSKLRNNPSAAAIPLALLAGGAGYLMGRDSDS